MTRHDAAPPFEPRRLTVVILQAQAGRSDTMFPAWGPTLSK
jgi:hypothetical protein